MVVDETGLIVGELDDAEVREAPGGDVECDGSDALTSDELEVSEPARELVVALNLSAERDADGIEPGSEQTTDGLAVSSELPSFSAPDFDLSDLKRLPGSGGSSDSYEVNGNPDIVVVAKRSEVAAPVTRALRDNPILRALSHTVGVRFLLDKVADSIIARREKAAPEDLKVSVQGELEADIEKLNRGGRLCKQFLGDAFMDCEFIVRKNNNGFPAIFRVQKKLPEGYSDLTDDKALQAIRSDAEAQANLSALLVNIDRMIDETGMAVDILTLGNLAYDRATKKFHLFDSDPLTTSDDAKEALSEEYAVDSMISNEGFRTATGVQTNNCMEVTQEHLRYLRELADVPA